MKNVMMKSLVQSTFRRWNISNNFVRVFCGHSHSLLAKYKLTQVEGEGESESEEEESKEEKDEDGPDDDDDDDDAAVQTEGT